MAVQSLASGFCVLQVAGGEALTQVFAGRCCEWQLSVFRKDSSDNDSP